MRNHKAECKNLSLPFNWEGKSEARDGLIGVKPADEKSAAQVVGQRFSLLTGCSQNAPIVVSVV